MGIRLIVCLKRVLDPELPARVFRVDASGRRLMVAGMRPTYVLDSYGENALELGIQLRDRLPGSSLTALCVGDADSDDVLRRAFALTANAAVRAWDDAWHDLDGMATAHIMARTISTIGGADLVLCGRQASDIEESVIGPALAEELGMPCIISALRVAPGGDGIQAECDADGIMQLVSSPLPAVVTVTSAPTNVARMARVKDAMLARRKPIRVVNTSDLSLDPERARPGVHIERLDLVAASGQCEMIGGAEVRAQAAALVGRLRALDVL